MLGTINGNPLNLDGLNEAGVVVPVTGTVSVSQADAVAASAGVAAIVGSGAAADGPAILASSGASTIAGSSAQAQPGNTLAIDGLTAIGADHSHEAGGQGLAGVTAVPVAGVSAFNQDPQTLESDAEIEAIRAVAIFTQQAQALAATATAAVAAVVDAAMAGQAAQGAGVTPASAALDQSELDDSLAAAFSSVLTRKPGGQAAESHPAGSRVTPKNYGAAIN